MRLGQGRENAKDYLRLNPALADEIEMAVRHQVMSGDVPLPVDTTTEDEGPGLSEDEV